MSSNVPLKLEGTNGDLQQMTSTEENYLAYVIGKDNLAADSGVGGITLTSTGNTSIGSFVDTFYNEAVGTHPASAITSGSTTTTLYQKDGTASIGGGLRPVGFAGRF